MYKNHTYINTVINNNNNNNWLLKAVTTVKE